MVQKDSSSLTREAATLVFSIADGTLNAMFQWWPTFLFLLPNLQMWLDKNVKVRNETFALVV